VGFALGTPLTSLHRAGVVAHFSVNKGEDFEVEQQKPLGVTWKKCEDGGIYVSKLDNVNSDPRIQVGDKLLEVSGSFGPDIWPADSYAQTMMAIQTRRGNIYMKILSRGGDTDVLQQNGGSDQFKGEREKGNYGAGTALEQGRRYNEAKRVEELRMEIFNGGVASFRAGKYEDALSAYKQVRDMEPKMYINDRLGRISEFYKVASYNIACCYSTLRNEQEALKELEVALSAGWEDYEKVRTDKNLAFVRESNPAKFKQVLERYDEPLFNENAQKMFSGVKALFR
jgi:tetratricopeptide (TPR) repeat protein